VTRVATRARGRAERALDVALLALVALACHAASAPFRSRQGFDCGWPAVASATAWAVLLLAWAAPRGLTELGGAWYLWIEST
jgi:hypothetical protein